MKRKHSPTSKEAELSKSAESKNRDYKRIEMAYAVIGQGHYEDVAKYLGLTYLNVVSRRMKEMRDLGILVNTGIKKLTSRNRNAFVHTLSKNKKVSKEKLKFN